MRIFKSKTWKLKAKRTSNAFDMGQECIKKRLDLDLYDAKPKTSI